MRWNTRTQTLLVALMAAAVAPVLLADGGHRCSFRSVSGTYGYTITGNILAGPAAGPSAGVGIITLDRDGNLLDGAQTRSFNGSIADETLDGTYTVNDDCTGEATVNVYVNGVLVRTSLLHVVWDDHSSELRAIFRSAFTALTVNGKKLNGD